MSVDDITNNKFEYIFLDKQDSHLCIEETPVSPLVIITPSSTSSLYIDIKNNINLEILEVILPTVSKELDVKREINIENNSQVIYNKIQLLPEDTLIDYTFNHTIKDKAKLILNLFEFGSKISTNQLNNNLGYKESSLNINALIKPKNNTQIINKINTTHTKPSTLSDIKFKHILDHFTKGKLELLSHVTHDASFSKAFQNSDTLLLSDDASIFVNPHLQIDIDELEASHGATTGSLDDEALLYLKSRGIDEKKANNMLIEAIEEEIYANISNTNLKEYILWLIRKYHV